MAKQKKSNESKKSQQKQGINRNRGGNDDGGKRGSQGRDRQRDGDGG